MHFLCVEPLETEKNVLKFTKNLVLKFHFLLLRPLKQETSRLQGQCYYENKKLAGLKSLGTADRLLLWKQEASRPQVARYSRQIVAVYYRASLMSRQETGPKNSFLRCQVVSRWLTSDSECFSSTRYDSVSLSLCCHCHGWYSFFHCHVSVSRVVNSWM